MRDEDDHGGPDDEDGLLGQNAGGAAPGYCACLSVAYYRPYFDVDTDEVAARLRAALFFCNEPFGATLRGKPDAYGPWWVATTLVFAVAVTSHVRGLLGAEAGVIYEFDFSAVTFAAATIYGYVALAAATNWAFLNYGLKVHQRPLACLCVVGYSLVPYLAAAPACALPYLAWPAVLAQRAPRSGCRRPRPRGPPSSRTRAKGPRLRRRDLCAERGPRAPAQGLPVLGQGASRAVFCGLGGLEACTCASRSSGGGGGPSLRPSASQTRTPTEAWQRCRVCGHGAL